MRVAGIDPGMSGAVALVDDGEMHVEDMPVVGKYVAGVLLGQMLTDWSAEWVVIEDVASYPRQGVASVFKFGCAFGVALGAVGALMLPMTLVTPAQWKKDMRLSSDKDRSRQRATEGWPESADLFKRKKDDGRAEAVLLAEWGRRFVDR